MFKIGIIGTENSHAMAFAKRINLPNEKTGKHIYTDARVVMVYGPDADTAKKVMDVAEVPEIAEKVEDFNGNVDAVMITSRSGSVHYKYAIPFIESGIPLFIDKPFTSNLNEAKKLIEAAQKNGTLIMGGSGCKYAQNVLDLKETVSNMKEESLLSVTAKFSADIYSEYDGFFFYASHLVEIILEVFGNDIKDIYACEKRGTVTAIFGYESYNVTLHFIKDNYKVECSLYCKGESIRREISLSDIHHRETDIFINMLRTGKMPNSYESLTLPVHIIECILESLKADQRMKY